MISGHHVAITVHPSLKKETRQSKSNQIKSNPSCSSPNQPKRAGAARRFVRLRFSCRARPAVERSRGVGSKGRRLPARETRWGGPDRPRRGAAALPEKSPRLAASLSRNLLLALALRNNCAAPARATGERPINFTVGIGIGMDGWRRTGRES